MKEPTLGQARKVLDLIVDKGIPEEQLQKLLESGLLADLLYANVDVVDRSEFRRIIGLKPADAFSVTVDYNKSLAEMIAAGRYDSFNSDINAEHFPVEGKGKQEKGIRLFHFNRIMTSEQVIAEMDKAGYRSVLIEELLVLGSTYPELQRQFPILALGSVWQNPGGSRHVAYLCWGDAERRLDLHWLGINWDDGYRFAGVRKVSS